MEESARRVAGPASLGEKLPFSPGLRRSTRQGRGWSSGDRIDEVLPRPKTKMANRFDGSRGLQLPIFCSNTKTPMAKTMDRLRGLLDGEGHVEVRCCSAVAFGFARKRHRRKLSRG